jgi:hypothetical protein
MQTIAANGVQAPIEEDKSDISGCSGRACIQLKTNKLRKSKLNERKMINKM